ncbi:MAG: hypothetical protein R2830_12275 [Saprospiraceae bacterium]
MLSIGKDRLEAKFKARSVCFSGKIIVDEARNSLSDEAIFQLMLMPPRWHNGIARDGRFFIRREISPPNFFKKNGYRRIV